MPLTPAQTLVVQADILADPVLSLEPKTTEGATVIAGIYNIVVAPTFWVFRTSLTSKEIYEATTSEGTTWDWTAYIARLPAERDAWNTMFLGSDREGARINPSLANTRKGIGDIFSGVAGAAQRTHLSTLGRRPGRRIEVLFATGAGTTAAPGLMGYEGPVGAGEILAAFSA